MKILSAIGWGIAIIVLKFLVPTIFAGIQNTLLMFFNTLQAVLGMAELGMQAAKAGGGLFILPK